MAQKVITEEVSKETLVHGYYDVVGESEFGRKLSPGDVITINNVNFVDAPYGRVAVFDTPEGRRYSGATAIMDFAEKLVVKPELFPVKVRVEEATSAAGRRYITFGPV